MYLISDEYGNYKKIMNYKELRYLLIDEIKNDIFDNLDNEGIVKDGVKQLIDIAKVENYDVKYFKEQLKSYGWYIDDLCELYRTINNLNEYCLRTDTKTKEDVKVLNDMLDFLYKEWNICI